MKTTTRPTVPTETTREPADDVTRPRYAAADCGPSHKRWFSTDRMREVREARGLSLATAAARMVEHGDGGDGHSLSGDRFTSVVLRLIEDGTIDPSPEIIFAAAHVYGVEPSAFTGCHDCMVHFVAPKGGAA